jgi:hypothetical protein
MTTSGTKVPLVYLMPELSLSPIICGFLDFLSEMLSFTLRINNLIYLAKLHRQKRSLGIRIALIMCASD